MADRRLILASRSPRRGQVLREHGYRFEQLASPFDDPPTPPPGEAAAVAVDLARRKALALRESGGLPDDAVVIGADTVVLLPDGSLCGTPTSRADAAEMIGRVVDATHEVVSGVAVLGPRELSDCFADAARVWVGRLGDAELTAYLDSGEWRGKAGGYNLFDRLDAGWPIRIEGDPTTVVGLPMRRLVPVLDGLGIERDLEGRGLSADYADFTDLKRG